MEAFIKTPIGACKIEGNDDGISAITLLDDEQIASDSIPKPLQSCAQQLHEYFDGKRHDFDLVLNPVGTDFQKEVWNALHEIPHGKTSSYMKQSKRLGDVKAIRAVANANGKNPIAIIIPCHRVIGSDGSLTGYAGGLWRKKWLLDHENPVKQQSLF